MSKRTMTRCALGLAIVGLFAVVGGAQPERSRYVDSGLFEVAKGQALRFHVSLEDRRTGPAIWVHLSVIDEHGTVRAQDDVMLEAGESTTLPFQQTGFFRVHAQAADTQFPPGGRRILMGSAELLDIDDFAVVTRFIPIHMHDDGAEPSRPQ